MKRSLWVTAGLLVGLLSVSGAFAANKFYISNDSLPVQSDDNPIPVMADIDQETIGFSISITFDPSKVQIAQVDPGAAISGLFDDQNFFDGQISNTAGTLSWGVALDISNPITQKISPGTAKELLVLSVDVIASSSSTTDLSLVNVPGERPRLNVMTTTSGDSVAVPTLTLQKGTLTLSDLAPKIQSILNNAGPAGKEFSIAGSNLNQPGLAVTLCGEPATITDVSGAATDLVKVLAPQCGSIGWAIVEVCTDFGCSSRTQGFNYQGGTLFIRGDANNDAEVDLSDAISILGDLFLGNPATAPCQDALDADDNGEVELTDAVYLLEGLFTGGDNPPPPYPLPGVDPTLDTLADC